MHVTPIYAALLALLFVGLSVRTLGVRRKFRVAVGDADNIPLISKVRSQQRTSSLRLLATDQDFVEYVQSQSGLRNELSFKKMFGEYALYLHGRVVAFACDNQLFLKPTEAGRTLLGKVSEAPAYPGSKLYFRLDEQLEDRELLRRALVTTAEALPLPRRAPAASRKATLPAGKVASAKSAKSAKSDR